MSATTDVTIAFSSQNPVARKSDTAAATNATTERAALILVTVVARRHIGPGS